MPGFPGSAPDSPGPDASEAGLALLLAAPGKEMCGKKYKSSEATPAAQRGGGEGPSPHRMGTLKTEGVHLPVAPRLVQLSIKRAGAAIQSQNCAPQ